MDPVQNTHTMPASLNPPPDRARGSAAGTGVLQAQAREVEVQAAGRLHLGFLDPSATLGRRFGSIGMMIEGSTTTVRLRHAGVQRIEGVSGTLHEVGRARGIIDTLQSATGLREPLDVRLAQALAPHVGLGSGTQLALALGRAFSELHGLQLSTPVLANLLGRGARSGIGIAGFDRGGVLVDGGPRAGVDAPPVLARLEFPDAWRVIVVQDAARSGLHGESEREGIARLGRFAQHRAAHLCHLVLMKILPALAEREFTPFANGVSELQRAVGEYFAPVQGGIYTSPAIGRLMRWIAAHHEAGLGQTSWGPTAFAIVPSLAHAQRIIAAAEAAGAIEGGLKLGIVAGRNQGAVVSSRPELVGARARQA